MPACPRSLSLEARVRSGDHLPFACTRLRVWRGIDGLALGSYGGGKVESRGLHLRVKFVAEMPSVSPRCCQFARLFEELLFHRIHDSRPKRSRVYSAQIALVTPQGEINVYPKSDKRLS